MDLRDFLDDITEREETFLIEARRQLKSSRIALHKATRRATTIEDLLAVERECIKKKNNLELLIELKGYHFGLHDKNHIEQIKNVNSRYFKMLSEILQEVEASKAVFGQIKQLPKNKHQHLKSFSDLFMPGESEKYTEIVKKKVWLHGMERLVDDSGKWTGKIEAGKVYLEELKKAGVINVPMSLAARLMTVEFPGFKDPKKKIEPDNASHYSNGYRRLFADDISRVKNKK